MRLNWKRDDGLSASGQLGKVGEHLACAELLVQGFNAYLADAAQPYDIVVDLGARFMRVQVKLTSFVTVHDDVRKLFAFRTRRRSGAKRLKRDPSTTACSTIRPAQLDAFAFVALPTRQIAWVAVEEVAKPDGTLRQVTEFRSRQIHVPEKRSHFGPTPGRNSRWMEDYTEFSRVVGIHTKESP